MLGRPWFFSSRFKWKSGLQSFHHYWNCHSISAVQVKCFTDHRCCGVTVWSMSHQNYQYMKEDTRQVIFIFFPFWMWHGAIYLLKLCITFQLDHCTVFLNFMTLLGYQAVGSASPTLAGRSSSSVRSWYRGSMTAPWRGGGRKEWGKI